MSRPQFQLYRSTKSKSARTRFAAKTSSLCKFPFADGRRCRMLRYSGHPHLCVFHARAELQQLEAARLGTELGQTLTGDFLTSSDINHALGRLYTAVAQGRIPARTGCTLAYIGLLLLHSVKRVKSEFTFSYKFESWQKMQQEAQPLSPAPTIESHSDELEVVDAAPNETATEDDATEEASQN